MEAINTEQNAQLNLVLLGRTKAGISASGNTILGREAFESKKIPRSVTQDVAVESGNVGDISVTVYDTPGLFNTELNDGEILKMMNEKVLQKCESGLCVFLLVIKADRFSEEERETVEKIEELLGEKLLEKTWILFTRGDELEDENMTIKEFINLSEPLKKLVQKYDQRYHVFNNKKRGHTGQVQTLLLKILKPYFDRQVSEILKQNPLKTKIPENVPADSPSSRRIVLLGKTGVGKSASGNTILGQLEFNSVMSTKSVTTECSEAHATVSGRSVSVVDTPGFFDTHMKPEELSKEIGRSVYLSSPGPHSFLIVFPVNNRFTEQEQQIPQLIEMMFGKDVLKYSIILFTHGDLLDGESVEKLIEENSKLRDLVDQCGGRFHVFNNKDLNNREQVNDLLQKIDTMIEKNGGGHYSNQIYEDALRFRQEGKEGGFMQFFYKNQRYFYFAAVAVGIVVGGVAGGVLAKAVFGGAVAKVAVCGAVGAVVGGAAGGGAASGTVAGAVGGAVAGTAVVGAVGGAVGGALAAAIGGVVGGGVGGVVGGTAVAGAVGGVVGGTAAGAVAGAVGGGVVGGAASRSLAGAVGGAASGACDGAAVGFVAGTLVGGAVVGAAAGALGGDAAGAAIGALKGAAAGSTIGAVSGAAGGVAVVKAVSEAVV